MLMTLTLMTLMTFDRTKIENMNMMMMMVQYVDDMERRVKAISTNIKCITCVDDMI